ncbi:hypothetical protein HN385_00165 [archaeon]|jgi:hypothetical protein|nr:hypothetical protein [archaeon]MBT3451572.1 hypothetical protein [archaeon]MBT6869039.1 hypothetical protein [archaeon]MBT7193627.1 hypothetical protein [archaeon]MBT7380160.1 hypothetical protein [archaeon]
MVIKLYRTENCVESLVVKNYLLAKNITFEEIIVDENYLGLISGDVVGKGFPILKIPGKIIFGFKQEELRALVS